jgi:CMP-N-acetylneuraminic acid synthetase
VILSTDDEAIADVGRRYGIEVPFIRPSELALDETPTLPVVQHAVRWIEESGASFDAVCLLQPTSPFRQARDIDGCIELLEATGADAVVSVLPVPYEYNPHWVYFEQEDGSLRLSTDETAPIARRQELPRAFHREGSVYVTRTDVLMNDNSFYGSRLVGYHLDSERRVNVDNLADWARAVELLAGGER